MFHYIVTYLPWLISVIGIYTAWKLGNKTHWIFRLKVFNQFLWVTWVIMSENWGFLPMSIIYTFIYFRNHCQWQADRKTVHD